MLPDITERLHRAFRHLRDGVREDALDEAISHCMLAYHRPHGQRRSQVASPNNLSWYAALQVKCGRAAVGRNGGEPLSRNAQIRHGIRTEDSRLLDTFHTTPHASVADQVAVRLHAKHWLKTLSSRLQKLAIDFLEGHSTSEAADKYHLLPGRISQLRRELLLIWQQFQGEVCTA